MLKPLQFWNSRKRTSELQSSENHYQEEANISKPDQNCLDLLPATKQKDVMLALGKASDFFRKNLPAYHLRGNGAAGTINDVVDEIENSTPKNAAND